MTIAYFNFLGRCIVQIQWVRSVMLCVHRKTFQSISRSNRQCPQRESICQVRNIPLEEQTILFLLKFGHGIYIFAGTKNFFKMLLEMGIFQHSQTKSVFTFQATKLLIFTTRKSANPALTFQTFLLRTINQQLCYLVVTVHIALQKKRGAKLKKENQLHF